MSVVVLIPSRSRPESLLKAYQSVLATSEASVLAYVDKDQEALYAGLPAMYVHERQPGSNVYLRGKTQPERLTIVTGRRIGPVASINQLCHAARPDGGLRDLFPDADIFTYLTDDSTVGPIGWDAYLEREIARFPNRIGVVSLAHAGADYVNFYAVSTAMIEAVGHYAIPGLHAWYWDTAMELVGDATRIVYARPEDVDILHEQQVTFDSLGIPDEDCRFFAKWCITDRKRIIQRVREKMV